MHLTLLQVYRSRVCLFAIAAFMGCFGKVQGNIKANPLNDVEKTELIGLEALMAQQVLDEGDSSRLLKLAILYQRDQELEKALKTFITSLELLGNSKQSYAPSKAELESYDEALKAYLYPKNGDLFSANEHIVKCYGPLLEKNPNFFKLGYIVAAAQANLGNFLTHFELFYNSYKNLPNDYLAHKTLAILHIKLLEKMMPSENKNDRYSKIATHLNEAAKSDILDYSLYKLMILYSSEQDKHSMTAKALQAIVDKNISIPRTDLPFFIKHGFEFCSLSQLEIFIAHLQKCHKYSRILASAEEKILLKQKEMVCQNPAL